MLPDAELETKIEGLDLSLFQAIPSSSSDGDKKSWLAIQRSVRAAFDQFVYLEIGSHLGGSIQPYLLDPKCRTIYSIDKRPLVQPDNRGRDYHYDGNSTERMLENLRKVDKSQTSKIVCFDNDAKDVDQQLVVHRPNLCFIDGEHTTAAVLSDFDFCMRVSQKEATIYFHDASIIYPAIVEIIRGLKRQKIAFRPLKLDGDTFAIVLGESPVLQDAFIRSVAIDGRAFLIRQQTEVAAKRLLPAPVKSAVKVAKRLLPPPLKSAGAWIAKSLFAVRGK